MSDKISIGLKYGDGSLKTAEVSTEILDCGAVSYNGTVFVFESSSTFRPAVFTEQKVYHVSEYEIGEL